jgi:NAD(P)H-nitrite reductase large subunit
VTTAGTERAVIVGASLAGATAAFFLRGSGFDGDIVLVGAETALPYERPALSKSYLAGDVELDKLLVRSVDAYDEHGVTLRLGQAATGLDADRRLVILAGGEPLGYDQLVIATGASNARPPIPGIDLAGVHQLRTAADADALRAELPGLKRGALTLTFAGAAASFVTGWLGGELVERLGVGVDADAHLDATSSLKDEPMLRVQLNNPEPSPVSSQLQ